MIYDISIIGGGTGGYIAAIRAAQHGRKVVLFEKGKLGGTCLHLGCIPTKTLLESSLLYNQIQSSSAYGIELGGSKPMLQVEAVHARKTAIITQLHQGITYLMKKNKITVVQGTASLARREESGSFIVAVQDGKNTAYEAKQVILATGSRPNVPPNITVDGKYIFTSDEILQVPLRPRSIAIVGAGAIGVEFACYFRELGAEVRLLEMGPRIVPLEEEAVSKELTEAFMKKGILIETNARLELESIRIHEEGEVQYAWQTEDRRLEEKCDAILMATGRLNNTTGLGLDRVGLSDGGSSVEVNEWMETKVPGLYAIGDITGSYQLAHVASAQALLAVDRICGKETLPYDPIRVPRCTYSHPQIASVGYTEQAAKDMGYDVKTSSFPLRPNGRSVIHGATEGFVKLVADANTDRLLGAHMVGGNATELIYGPSLALLLETTVWELGMNVYPHPTVSEVFGEAAHAALGHADHA